MKLAPTTTACRAAVALAMMARAVGKRAQNVDMRLIRARKLQMDRLGAGRKKQFVICDFPPVRQRHLPRPGVDCGNLAAELKVDRIFLVPLSRLSGIQSSGAVPAR